jgi:hypothetical protein
MPSQRTHPGFVRRSKASDRHHQLIRSNAISQAQIDESGAISDRIGCSPINWL